MALPEHLDDEERQVLSLFNIAHRHPTDVDSSPSSPSSPSDTLNYLFANRQTRSTKHRLRSNADESTSRLLTRLLARDDDIRAANALITATNERLTNETARADTAEHRALEYFTRLRSANEARERAEQDVNRLKEELRLYSVQLENAQKEIFRAQDIIAQVAAQKSEAEADAARARTTARKLQEEKLVMQARDEGRKEGYKEGWSRGRRLGYVEGREIEFVDSERHRSRQRYVVQEEDDGDDEEPFDEVRVRPAERPQSAAANRRQSSQVPLVNRPGSAPPVRNYDTAPHAANIPVRTVVTPRPLPSPSHEPLPLPIPAHSRSPETIHPIPIRLSPSPTFRPTSVPPDGWIPRADSRTSRIAMPSPHELIQPVESALFGSSETSDNDHPPVRTHDYAYPSQRSRAISASSRSSTRISQYDLVSAPTGRDDDTLTSRSSSVNSVNFVPVRTWTGSHPQLTPVMEEQRQRSETESIAEHWRAENSESSTSRLTRPPSRPPLRRPREVIMPASLANDASRQTRTETPPAAAPNRARSPLDYLFRHRFRQRTSSSSIPQIVVESPSESQSNGSETAVTHPELLSPDAASRSVQLPSEDLSHSNQSHQTSHTSHQAQPADSGSSSSPTPSYWPAGFIPLSGPPPSPPTQSEQRRPASRAASRGAYDIAPVPSGVLYPEPPSRPQTSSENRPYPSHRDAGLTRLGYDDRSLSPAPLQRPISIFNDPLK
ncbi:hypothetical protein SERLADRAFT_441263 [Serpula lacrymans var. lacrymans S7.9]|uniref:Uncharacterized protein n=1 Tax=Serpula lacrymans var. lacrymans (strain S7.9) TaxID=578457 RepID=F8P607_SERL9|nr:uncharacterized protein SERLADRAFT_441263 [Serpula lacrymans var. lacrymans S7.9]EGO22044.1 hypothetical protein SERLADRAFT_441263 [Serpula lacrymans var. lacrymans S7.9]